MAVFQSRKFRGSAYANTFGARYRAAMAKHPFLLFGLPFMSVIVAASFVLTPATAIRYERHDRKVRQMTREEELGVGKGGRKVDIREEYYVRWFCSCVFFRSVLVLVLVFGLGVLPVVPLGRVPFGVSAGARRGGSVGLFLRAIPLFTREGSVVEKDYRRQSLPA
jgi:cytochrome c oxidase assembly protein subunit 16